MVLFFFALLPVCGSKFNQPVSCPIQHAFLSVAMPCPSPLFQRGPHTGKEPAQEMCATDSKARGQNPLCPLELKVQLRDMGLQICSSPDSISIRFGQVFPPYISFFPSGIGTYILCPYILEECKLFKNFLQTVTVNRLP